MSRLLLVRHGDTEFNSTRRFLGHTDIELSPEGLKQVRKLRDRLASEKIDLAYASDLKRAAMTARLISSGHELDIISSPELREINYGEVEGLTFDEISHRYPDVAKCCVDWSKDLKFPGGESFEEFTQRIGAFSAKLKNATEQTILVVAHGGPLRVLLCYLLGMELRHWRQFQLDVASLSIVSTHREIAIVNLLNDTSHLKETG
ncbi:MAG: alpha-ribazole phosphatase [Chloroflexi bacterium]|nr:alpha-ribazole phosphatase [Chloroflexota bacterium]